MTARLAVAALYLAGLTLAACSHAPMPPDTRPTEKQAMASTLYDAYRIDGSGGRQKIGTVTIERGRLAIASLVDEADRKSLQASLDEFNNRPFLVEKAPPEGDERYAVGAKEYERGQPGFDEVLIRKLESGRGIRLEPVK